jgi:hypothetical protein
MSSRPRDHAEVKALAERLGKPLYALSLEPRTDPFLAGQASRKRNAEWFAGLWNQLGGTRGFHLRRFHYLVMSQDPPPMLPDGTPYVNSEKCVGVLYNAGRDARHLGLVDADDLVDRKNPIPEIHLQEAEPGKISCREDLGVEDPARLEIPRLVLDTPAIAQRYQVELWCEKSTMNDILMPLGQRLGVNVITGTGELSLTHCVLLVRRAQTSRRPVRILYISDFDPAGAGMPIAVARKIEHVIYREQLHDLDIQVRPIILTHDQCIEYRLPRSPIKESEKRAGRFEERFGEGATELDALEALRPGEMERILTEEIGRYYDFTLASQVQDQAHEIQAELEQINAEVHASNVRRIFKLKKERKRVLASIRVFKRKAARILKKIRDDLDDRAPDIDQYDWPEPADGKEDSSPLFDSARQYPEQIACYKKHQGRSTEPLPRRELEKVTCICEHCHRSFQSARPTARACSDVCRTNLWRAGKGTGRKGAPRSDRAMSAKEAQRRHRERKRAARL